MREGKIVIDKRWLTKGYTDYIHSIEWFKKRDKKLESVNNKCFYQDELRYRLKDDGSYIAVPACCGPLQVHHLRYENLGSETLDDLRVLCKYHHDRAHELISSQNRVNSAIDTFAEKKYGEDWQDRFDYDLVSDEFYEWIENK